MTRSFAVLFLLVVALVGGGLIFWRSRVIPQSQNADLTGNFRGIRNFQPSEFREWAGLMSRDLLVRLDRFRDYLGVAVIVSPDPGAIGRRLGPDDTSQHNVDRYGEVRAVDVVFGADVTGQQIYDAARRAGFTGIGIYPDAWRIRAHLDVRQDRTAANPATWAYIAGEFTGIGEVLA